MPIVQHTCYGCGTVCEGKLTDRMVLEGDIGDSVCEQFTCPSCGEELYVQVITLKHGDESGAEELVDEGCELDGLADDI